MARSQASSTSASPLTIALAGNPNCGKTTLFNALTGLRQKVANYPGVTVEKKTGRFRLPAADPLHEQLLAGADLLGPARAMADADAPRPAFDASPGQLPGQLPGTAVATTAEATAVKAEAVSTRDRRGGPASATDEWASVIDLPGTYSLISRSPDEVVTMEVLRGLRPGTPPPDVVIVVVDASNLQRNLYLVSQLIELGRPLVVALNMVDIARRRGVNVSADRLAAQLGVPVVPVVGHKKQGIDDLKRAIRRAAVAPLPRFDLPPAMWEELDQLADVLGRQGLDGGGRIDNSHGMLVQNRPPRGNKPTPPVPPVGDAATESTADAEADVSAAAAAAARPTRHAVALAERLLIGDFAGDVRQLADRPAIRTLLGHAADRLAQSGIDPVQADVEAHYRWIDDVASNALEPACAVLDGLPAPARPVPRRVGEQAGPGNPAGGVMASSDTASTGQAAMGAARFTSAGDAAASISSPSGSSPAGSSPAGPSPGGPSPAGPSPAAAPIVTDARRPLHYARVPVTLTEKADRILLHRVWGLMIFAAIMGVVFVSIFYLAAPLMDATEAAVAWLGSLVAGWLPDGPVRDLWSDGIVGGVGGVLVFIPQIAVLFLFLAILEDSGYLARAAFLMDRLLGKVGLHGKAFIPLLSSFACAIPGIMATRTIENRRDRLATIFIAPFMSCSARLPVYALLIGAFFASAGHWVQGAILFGCYALGIVAAVVTAFLFKRTLLRGAPPAFILELPTYKVPQISQVARVVWNSTKAFIVKAGTTIFALSVILWALMYYPRLSTDQREAAAAPVEVKYDQAAAYIARHGVFQLTDHGYEPFNLSSQTLKAVLSGDKAAWDQARDDQINEAIAAETLRHSFAGRFGHLIEPAIRPLGYDWKMGIGLVGAFGAREVFVSTMGIVYSAGDADDDTTTLRQAMAADHYANGRTVWAPLVAISLLVFFVLAMQCMSTLAIVRRETQSWRWPIGMLVYMTGLAYLASLAVFQLGSWVGM